MENLETTPLSAPLSPPENDLQSQVDSLRHMLASVLVLIVIVAGTFDLFLLRLVKNTRTERDGMNAMVAEYNKTTAPAMNDFVKKLTDFGKTHADFNPILVKYGLVNRPGAAPSTATPAATTPPAGTATAPAPKKK